MSDAADNRVIDDATFLNTLGTSYADLITAGSSADGDGLYFSGPNAMATNGGNPVGLYSPEILDPGSSVAHLDDDNPAFDGSLMVSSVSTGQAAREFNEIELAILRDLGYTQIQQIGQSAITPPILPPTPPPAVPVPAPLPLLLAGLGMMGLLKLRRA